MTEYTKKLFGQEINNEIRAIGFNVLKNVVTATPVDTGRARGNWQIGINFSINGTLNSLDKSGSGAINIGARKLFSVNDFETIWITNNLSYIGDLNNGSSRQAPAKFVETGIVRALS